MPYGMYSIIVLVMHKIKVEIIRINNIDAFICFNYDKDIQIKIDNEM